MTDLQEVKQDGSSTEPDRKRWDAIWWAGALIWIGLTLGAHNLDVLPEVADVTEWWPWIFFGLGPWSLLLNVLRLATDAPSPTTWDWIWTFVFLGVGVGVFVDVSAGTVGAAVLIAVGLVVLFRAVADRD